jgi:hypothetical protein
LLGIALLNHKMREGHEMLGVGRNWCFQHRKAAP